MRAVLLLLLAADLLAAAPVPKPPKKPDDVMAIVGTWNVQRVTDNATPIDGTAFKTYVFDADGNCTQFIAGGGRNDFTYTLDDRATPKRVKLKYKGADNVALIYDLTGDTLRLGYVAPGASPEKVEPVKGVLLIELKRDTPGK
jgi:uncharacterized protein (TIGR03067 family)